MDNTNNNLSINCNGTNAVNPIRLVIGEDINNNHHVGESNMVVVESEDMINELNDNTIEEILRWESNVSVEVDSAILEIDAVEEGIESSTSAANQTKEGLTRRQKMNQRANQRKRDKRNQT